MKSPTLIKHSRILDDVASPAQAKSSMSKKLVYQSTEYCSNKKISCSSPKVDNAAAAVAQ